MPSGSEFPPEMRVSVSIDRKLNLGNYESVSIFMSISGVEPGASEEEIEEAMQTGDRALVVLKRHLQAQINKVRRAQVEAG